MFRRADISSLCSLSGASSPASSGSVGPSPLDEITAPPREFTSDEVAELSSLIRGCLKLTNCACALQAEEDANDFVNYAVDLIADGLCVISVLEELDFMDMTDICPPASLDEMRTALPAFLGTLHDKDGRPNPCKAITSSSSASRGRRRLSQEIREGDTYLAAFDLSAKTAANKKRQELAMLTRQGCSIRERMGGMYSEDGTLKASSGVIDGDELDPAALEKQREDELNAIVNDVSLSEKEQTNKLKEVRGRYGVLEMKMRIARASRASSGDVSNDGSKEENAPKETRAELELRPGKGRRSSIDLSAKSAAVNKAKELALLQKQGSSLKDRKSMYSGTLRNSFKNPNMIDLADLEDEEEEVKEKSIDELRREELLTVMKDKTLSREEKTRKMDEVRARWEEAAATAVEEALDMAINEAKMTVGCGDNNTVTTASSLTDSPPFNESGNIANTGSAFSSSPIDEIAAPHRDLTEEELTDLRALIKGALKLNNVSCALDAEEDAADLINYGIDLITDCMSVGVVLEELDFMELEICPAASLEELRTSLSSYFGRLHKKDTGKNPLDESQKGTVPAPDREAARRRGCRTSIDGQAGSGVPRRRLSQEMREGSAFVKVDLSAGTASRKKREELARLSKRGGSIKDRMAMYAEDGTLKASSANPSDGAGDELNLDGLDQASLDARRQEELEDIANDVSLSEKEQLEKTKAARAKYGMLEMQMRIAKASASAKATHAGEEGTLSVPRAERELRPGKGRRSSIDLSAKSSVVTKARELAQLKKQGSSLKDRMAMYSSEGTLRSSFKNHTIDLTHLDDEGEAPKEKSIDELRREELMKVMRDRSLSREEKTRQMDFIREKYAPPEAIVGNEEQSSDEENRGEQLFMEARRPSEETVETAATSTASLDLSAQCSARRRRASLEECIASGRVGSLRDRKSMYENNEFVVNV